MRPIKASLLLLRLSGRLLTALRRLHLYRLILAEDWAELEAEAACAPGGSMRGPSSEEPLSHALGGGLDISGTGGIGILYLRRLDAYPIAVGVGANWPGVIPRVPALADPRARRLRRRFPGARSADHGRGVVVLPTVRVQLGWGW